MNIDITKLKSGINNYIIVEEEYTFTKEEIKNTEIMEPLTVKIKGDITKNSLDEYIINIDIKGTMVLPCAVTLKPVNYDFSTNIEGNLTNLYEEIGKNLENNQKTIDILPIIWENILMEIPIRVVSPDISDAIYKGDGWELITNED